VKYIYAILHSQKYRKKYAEFLQFAFPRIPFPEKFTEFEMLYALGEELVNLHLMKIRQPTETKYNIEGSNVVEFLKYKNQRLYINGDQFFAGIPKEVWNFYLGSYRVLEKWLKSRKNRKLSGSEIELFLQIIEIIKKTTDYMTRIDKLYIS